MGANETEVKTIDDTYKQSKFSMSIPISTYLIALAIGDLEYHSLGDRVGVLADPD